MLDGYVFKINVYVAANHSYYVHQTDYVIESVISTM